MAPPNNRTAMAARVGAAITTDESAVDPVRFSTPKAIAIGAIAVPE